jgi:hypothetical protein
LWEIDKIQEKGKGKEEGKLREGQGELGSLEVRLLLYQSEFSLIFPPMM